MRYLKNKYALTLHDCVKKVVLDFSQPSKYVGFLNQIVHDVAYGHALLKLYQGGVINVWGGGSNQCIFFSGEIFPHH